MKGIARARPNQKRLGSRLVAFAFTFLQPAAYGLATAACDSPLKNATNKFPYITPSSKETVDTITLCKIEDFLVSTLARAGRCENTTTKFYPALAMRSTVSHQQRLVVVNGARTRHAFRHYHQLARIHRPRSAGARLSHEECLNMIDYYSDEYSTLTSPPIVRSNKSSENQPTSALARIKPKSASKSKSSELEATEHPAIQNLLQVIHHEKCSHEEAWQAYSAMPPNALEQLSDESRRRLLQCLSIIRTRGKTSMLRYLSVMDRMKLQDLPTTEAQWNSAIAFAARGFDRINDAGVESALLKWKEMEQQAQVTSGHVTFNILFDLAVKAGKFALADMLLQEMESRNLKVNRFARVGMIYYHGVRGNGDGVRGAYRDFVEAGEIVDTIVMNCVIASLLRAGEQAAAEQVYERMKRVLKEYTGQDVPHLTWQEHRELGRILDKAARRLKNDPSKLEKIRAEQFLVPNADTYGILLNHHILQTGELRRVASYLAEMQELGVPIDGRLFVKIFKGFSIHGGIRYTVWTTARLESVWTSLLQILDQNIVGVRLNKWLAIWIMRAFDRCCGSQRALNVWEELRRRWQDDLRELAAVQDILKDVLAAAVREAALNTHSERPLQY